MPVVPPSQIAQQAIGTSMAGLSTGIQNVLNTSAVLNRPWNAPPAPGINAGSSATTQNGWLTPGAQQAMHQLNAHAQNVLHAQLQQAQAQAGPSNSQPGPSAMATQQVATDNGDASSSSATAPAPAPQATTTITTTTTTTAGANGQVTQPPTVTVTTTRQPPPPLNIVTANLPPATAAPAAAPPAVNPPPQNRPRPIIASSKPNCCWSRT